MPEDPYFPLAVIVVTYNSGRVIGPCLDSLLDVPDPRLQIVVVDNASSDETVVKVRDRFRVAGRHRLELIEAAANGGYAAGVNLGLARLADAGLVWILNPDCTVPVATPDHLLAAARATPGFSLMGGRTLYARPPHRIQSDGGRVGHWTGVCRLVNNGSDRMSSPPDVRTLGFISGANMMASRAFLDRAGPMEESFFLYYEEVDWAARRGDLPLALCPLAVVHHQAGTAIGSAGPRRRATGFANYFNYRSRMRYVRRHRLIALPIAVGFALLKVAHLVGLGAWSEAGGALRGVLGMPPPADVRRRLGRVPSGRAQVTGRQLTNP